MNCEKYDASLISSPRGYTNFNEESSFCGSGQRDDVHKLLMPYIWPMMGTSHL